MMRDTNSNNLSVHELTEDDFDEYLNELTEISDPVLDPEEEQFLPFTGEEFIATHESIDEHPYAFLWGQLLGRGVEPNVANELAFGLNVLNKISDDIDNPLRNSAWKVYDYCVENDYWRNSGDNVAEYGEPKGFGWNSH